MKRIITLDEKDYQTLLSELHSLWGYHMNDDTMHRDDCGSKVVAAVEANTIQADENS